MIYKLATFRGNISLNKLPTTLSHEVHRIDHRIKNNVFPILINNCLVSWFPKTHILPKVNIHFDHIRK